MPRRTRKKRAKALFLAIEGRGPQPFPYWLGRLCEEFHCLPSQAYQEWLRTPCGLLEEIIEARVFVAAKAIYDRAHSAKDIPQEPIYDLIREVDFELAAEHLAEQKAMRKQPHA